MRRLALRALLSGAVVIGATAAIGGSARADTPLQVPDATHASSYMNCAWNTDGVTANTNINFYYSCQTAGAVVLTATSGLTFTYEATGSIQQNFNTTISNNVCIPANACVIDANDGHFFRFHIRVAYNSSVGNLDRTCKGTASSAPAYIAMGGAGNINYGGSTGSRTVARLCPAGSGSYPPYPPRYFPGGSAGPPPPQQTNGSCGGLTDNAWAHGFCMSDPVNTATGSFHASSTDATGVT